MTNTLKYILTFLTALFFSLIQLSCNNTNEEPVEVPAQIITKSLALFDGEVTEKDLQTEEGDEVWKVKIKNAEGAVVSLYWFTSVQELVKIEGSQGPYDYEINPGMNLINFSTARTFAVSAVKSDQITGWKLKQENDFIGSWVYTFEIDTGSGAKKVYIDATSGDILQID